MLLFLLMVRRPPGSTLTDTLFPYPALFRSGGIVSRVLTTPAFEPRSLARTAFARLDAQHPVLRGLAYSGWNAAARHRGWSVHVPSFMQMPRPPRSLPSRTGQPVQRRGAFRRSSRKFRRDGPPRLGSGHRSAPARPPSGTAEAATGARKRVE